jgi:ribA/ribD-fused uncharacterized protein
MEPITTFRGQHFFLSNFYPARVDFEGLEYPTVEHAYQAAKTVLAEERIQIQSAMSPSEAKRLGRQITIRSDWDGLKIGIMAELVFSKFFEHPALGELLVGTGTRTIVEENWWGDTFWGTCRGKGRNELGRILMNVREALRQIYACEAGE